MCEPVASEADNHVLVADLAQLLRGLDAGHHGHRVVHEDHIQRIGRQALH